MAARIGTLEWARRSGGRLSVGERLRLASEGVAMQVRAMPPFARRRAGVDGDALKGAELPGRPVDSVVAREAEELCAEVSSEALLNHCFRTYVWGSLLGQRDGLRWDEEFLWVSALLHDLGLTEKFDRKLEGVDCFSVEGALAAADFAAESGWDETRRDRLAEVISLHLNVNVPAADHGAEAHLLHAGAGYDVIGRRWREIPREVRHRELERHPRLGFTAEIDRLTGAKAAARPASRVGFFYRRGGFDRMIRAAPFEE